MELLKQSTAVTLKFGPFLDETDGKTAEEGLTITQADVRLSVNGGNMAQKNETTSLTHDEIGFYDLLLNATDTANLGKLKVMVHEAGALPVFFEYMVVPANTYDSLVLGTDNIDAQTVAITNSAINSSTFTAGAITASSIATAAITDNEIANAAFTNAKFATDAIGADELAADGLAEIADAVWNELMSGHLTAGSYGKAMFGLVPISGAVNDAGPNTWQFDTDGFVEASDSHFDGSVMIFVTGALTGQSRIISAYLGTGQNCWFDRPWTEAPVTNDEFVIVRMAGPISEALPQDGSGRANANVEMWRDVQPNSLISNRVDTDVNAMGANVIDSTVMATGAIDTAALAAGAIHVNAMATGSIKAATFAAGAIDAAAIAANAIGSSELATGAIVNTTFAAGAIDNTAIAANAIGASELATDAIDQTTIAVNAIGAAEMSTEAAQKIRGVGPIGVTDSGTASTIVDATAGGFGDSTVDDYWNGMIFMIVAGSLAGLSRLITDYDQASDTITVTPAFPATVGAGQTYEIIPWGAVNLELWKDSAPNALVIGRIDSSIGNMAANVLDAAAINTGAITDTAFASNAITAAKVEDGAISTGTISTAARDEIADNILKRDLDQVEATMAKHSLGTAALKAVSRVVDDAGTLKVYRTDGTTLHLSQTITTNPSADPIDELVVGV